ncbi:hypothetical protein RB595_008546 [Gaeumannomyces hyphopodioides]
MAATAATVALVASCVGLANGIVVIFNNVYECAQDLHDAPDDVRQLVLDVQAAEVVLRRLKDRPAGVETEDEGLVKNLEGAESCLKKLELLAVQHEKRMRSNKTRGSLAFTWQKKKIQKQRKDLKGRVGWVLQILNMEPNTTCSRRPLATASAEKDGGRPPTRPKLSSLNQRSSLQRKLHLEESRQLVEAAKIGDLEQVKSSLEAGACIDYQSLSGEPKLEGKTALHMAVENGHAGVVEFLLKNGASPNEHVRSRSNEAALHLAAAGGHDGILQLLLCFRHGHHVLDLDARDGGGLTALLSCKDEPLMIALLAAGADPTCKGAGSNTALHHAASNGWDRAVRYLVGRGGVRMDVRNEAGHTPLEWAQRAQKQGSCSRKSFKAVARELAAAGGQD